ncbi:unnamed protein product, partial [Prorocentrum cordatum]
VEAGKLVGLSKIFQTEFSSTCIVKHVRTGKISCLHFDNPCWLQHVDRTTGEAIVQALDEQVEAGGFLQKMLGNKRRARLITSDDAGSNDRAHRFYQIHCGLAGRIPCSVHKLQALGPRTGVLVDSSVTGILNSMLALGQ